MEEKIEVVLHKMDGSEIKIPVVVTDEIQPDEIYIYDSSEHVYKVVGLLQS